MNKGTAILTLFICLSAGVAMAQGEAPPQAYADCRGKKAGDAVQHATPDGTVPATCVDSPGGLVARPVRGQRGQPGGGRGDRQGDRAAQAPAAQGSRGGGYSIEQATSDEAQLRTIAFDGLAFLTGDFGLDTFLPPGKVSDFFGFQYLRDVDAGGRGHSTSFLTRIADNVLAVLDAGQRERLVALAREQQGDIRRFAEMRFPLIAAFRRNLAGDLPAGRRGLDREAVAALSAELYALDGRLAFRRAQVMGGVVRSLSERQRSALAALRSGDSRTWPEVPEQIDRRSLPHEVHVAVMTYASELFSWYAGSLDADTYFCPERHGMYFGGFGMKTAPAMGKRDYAISTSLTGDGGGAFLAALTDAQRQLVAGLVDRQRRDLAGIVATRRAIALELRRFLQGDGADEAKVLALARRYGELDGDLSYHYATAFAEVGRTLTARQRETLAGLRATNPADPRGPFLYSSPTAMPEVGSTDFLFGAR